MSSFITLLCIFGLCVFMYSYISMYNLNKDFPTKCKVLYIPETDDITRESSPHMEVLEHETHDSTFSHTGSIVAPLGISEIDDTLSSNIV
jgi:hypothetical protein